MTWRSCIASSSADWVRGVARLISSTSRTFVNTGPCDEAQAAGLEQAGAGDVGRQQVGRALDARRCRATRRPGDRAGEQRLAGARDVLDAARARRRAARSRPAGPSRRRRRPPARRRRAGRPTGGARPRRAVARPRRSSDAISAMRRRLLRSWRRVAAPSWKPTRRRVAGSGERGGGGGDRRRIVSRADRARSATVARGSSCRSRRSPASPPRPTRSSASPRRTAPTRATRKINLSSGVFVDETGTTPVLPTVIEAERRLADAAGTKLYRPIDGEAGYRELVRALVLGADHEAVTSGRALATQTPGGTGGLRVAADLLQPDGREPDAVDERADVAQPPAAVPRRGLPGPDVPVHRRDGAADRRGGDAGGARGRLAGRRRAAPRRVPQPDRRRPVARAVAPDRRRGGGAAAAAARRPRLPGLRRRAARGRGRAARARPAGRRAAGLDLVLEDVLAVRRAGRGDARHRRDRRPTPPRSRATSRPRSARTTRTRRPTAPTSSARSSPTRTCAPAGRPSSPRCATGSRPIGGRSSRRWRRARSPATGAASRRSAGCSRCSASRRTRSPDSATSTRSTWSATAGSTWPASPPSNLDPFADALGGGARLVLARSAHRGAQPRSARGDQLRAAAVDPRPDQRGPGPRRGAGERLERVARVGRVGLAQQPPRRRSTRPGSPASSARRAAATPDPACAIRASGVDRRAFSGSSGSAARSAAGRSRARSRPRAARSRVVEREVDPAPRRAAGPRPRA